MLAPNKVPIYVRASVSDRCNLKCIYCSNDRMENPVPSNLRNHSLNVKEYCNNLEHLARNGFRGISFTGGEPTLNPDLPIIVARAAELFDQVELTTNGCNLPEMLPQLAPNLDLLKVSLDAADPQIMCAITRGTFESFNRAVDSIRLGCAIGLNVGVNVVVMRSTIGQIDNIINFCRKLNAEGFPGEAYVSLLDFYYSDERRSLWEQEFVPLSELETLFTSHYGQSIKQEKFGCRFFWFDAYGVQVRFKDSYHFTNRAPKCKVCSYYCQEGIYSLIHSVQGWVTTCPTDDQTYGVHLSADLHDKEVDCALAPLLDDIYKARPYVNSFKAMLKKHNLNPRSI